MVREGIRAELALAAYIWFHSRLGDAWRHCVVASFDDVVRDFGRTIAAVNARYATSYAVFAPNPKSERWVRERVEHYDRVDQGELNQATVAIPSASRTALNHAGTAALEAHPGLVRRAQALHDRIAACT